MNHQDKFNYEGFQREDIFFETFDVHEMAEELAATLDLLNFSAFNGKHVVIALPIYDESLRNIRMLDKPLFVSQKKDAFVLRRFLERKTENVFISIIAEPDEVRRMVQLQIKVDYLILLHEFTQKEEDGLIETLGQDAGNSHLKVFRLY